MKKEVKDTIIVELGNKLKEYPHFYLVDVTGLNAEKTSSLRRKCFKNEIKMVVVGYLTASTASGLGIDGFFNLSNSNSYVTASNTVTEYKTRSIFGTATVGFDDTYFLDGSLRNDWDSKLPKSSNSYLYGGLSASVLVSNFFKEVKW